MRVLAIETSCDDTSLAIVSRENNMIVCEEMVSFHQIALHSPYGGVVPELASREHLTQFIPVLYQLCRRFTGGDNLDILMQSIDGIAVTHSPGLPGSLLIGRTGALVLSAWFHIPCQYVNHLDGHIFSYFLDRIVTPAPSTLILSVSGGHSDLSLLLYDQLSKSVYSDQNASSELGSPLVGGYFRIMGLGSTRDDAVGEVYDKISRMLGGPYPGGLWISQQAEAYNESYVYTYYKFATHIFKRTLLKDTYDFSFSGLKSQTYNFITLYRQQLGLGENDPLPDALIQYIAYQFQEAATDILITRILQILGDNDTITSVALVGGVSANTRLREKLDTHLKTFSLEFHRGLQFYTPLALDYCTDNAAMIGAAALLYVKM